MPSNADDPERAPDLTCPIYLNTHNLNAADIDEEKAHYERVVHELICPLGSTTSELDYEDHNLWIIDDRLLAFYSYFNSDKQMKAQAQSTDKHRPDITLFDLGMGFEKGASLEPITIIEFKRPKRDDYWSRMKLKFVI